MRVDSRHHDAVIIDLRAAGTGSSEDADGFRRSLAEVIDRIRNAGLLVCLYAPGVNAPPADGIDQGVPVHTGTAGVHAAVGGMGVRPERCVVVTRSDATVADARSGGFALIVAIGSADRAAALHRCGADLVVGDVVAVPVHAGFARMSTLDDALECYREIGSLMSPRQPLILLDFDGTLSEIVEDPTTATLVDGAAEAIRTLADQCPVAIVSGRSLPDLVARVGLPGIWYAGIDGVLPGDERFGTAVELHPDIDWGTGSAVQWIVDRMPLDGRLALPMYIGDDLTDEDAFDAVRNRGIGIAVRNAVGGDRPTAARFAVDGPAAVRTLLATMSEQLSREQDGADTHWKMTFAGYVPSAEKTRETLCTMANGYVGVRGAAPESRADDVHYPGTYAAGVYNRLSDRVAGLAIDNESMVNLPNWLPLTFRVDGGAWFDVDRAQVLSYSAHVDLRRATFTRIVRVQDGHGRITRVAQVRLASMGQPHVLALATDLCAENWSGRVEIRSYIDGSVTNSGVERYRALSGCHVHVHRMSETADGVALLEATTVQSKVRVALAMRTSIAGVDARRRAYRSDLAVGHDLTVDVVQGRTVHVEKVAAVFTSRDHAIGDPAAEAVRELEHAGCYDDIERRHRTAWAHLWERFDVDMRGDAEVLRTLRFHQMHVLACLSPHTVDLDVGVTARGLHGEAYRGHVFWDELFVLPVVNLHMPEVTKSLLRYRFRRLPEARRAAGAAGCRGAMFPWQSGSDGREESQQMHVNPRSGRWNPDASARAHHVGIAIAYNIWQYYQATADRGFLIECGAELLVEIARFWVSRAEFDDERCRYVIRGVIGPDEFHSGYPGRDFRGIDDNAYTNVMAVWVIMRATEALDRMPPYYRLALLETLGIDDAELSRWEDVSTRMYVPFHDGVISQFDGYEKLEELDWQEHRAKYDDLQRLDRILEAEGDDVNRYKAAKQADTLMLFYLLSADELYELLGRLGYPFAPEQIPRTIAYYEPRTSHGSTLSAVVHAWVLARGNRGQAMQHFRRALDSDVLDVQRGTTAEGIHLAAMAGSIDLVQRCFTGLELRGDRVVVGPLWPQDLGALAFTFRYRGHRLRLTVLDRSATIDAEPGDAPPVTVECRGDTRILEAGATVVFEG